MTTPGDSRGREVAAALALAAPGSGGETTGASEHPEAVSPSTPEASESEPSRVDPDVRKCFKCNDAAQALEETCGLWLCFTCLSQLKAEKAEKSDAEALTS